MAQAIITSSGAYAPEQVITNAYFNELLGQDVDTWLRENVHIYERRWTGPDESTADLAEAAARQALERAGIQAAAIDLIILATDTPEYVSPSTASVVQHRLGAVKAGTFDVNTACAGFVTAMDIGSKYIRADDQYQYVLVIGAYNMSKYLNLEDKKTVTLFADGAGAVVLRRETNSQRGIQATKLLTEGQYSSWMGIYGGGTAEPINEETLRKGRHRLQFVQKFPPELNPEKWSALAQDICGRMNITPADIAQYFITQININSIWETLDRLDVPRERAHTVMHHYGYTGSACIPMAFNDAWEKGKVKEGDPLLFIGSGGGLAFAAAGAIL